MRKRISGHDAGIRLSAYVSAESQSTASARLQRSSTLIAVLIASGAALSCLVLASTALVSITSPSAYPRWNISNIHRPISHIALNGSRLEWVIVNRINATASDSPAQVLQWFKDQGWMENFRYSDSAIRQTDHRLGIMTLSTVEEVFVDGRSPGAYITSTTQTVIMIGR